MEKKTITTDRVLDVMDYQLLYNVAARVYKYEDKITIHYCKGNFEDGPAPWTNITAIKTFKLGEMAVLVPYWLGDHTTCTIQSFESNTAVISSNRSISQLRYVDFCNYNRP